MKKFKIFTILTLVVSSIIITGCYKDGNSSSKKSGFSSPEEFIENPSVKNAINESGIPVNYGDTPPALAGTYLVNGNFTDASYELYSFVGTSFQSEVILSKQTNTGKIDYAERIDDYNVKGSGGYITGNNGRFTIYQESRQSGSEAGLPNGISQTVVMMMSGTKSNNGNLTSVKGITIITEISNASYTNLVGLWWIWDATFYLQAGN